MPETKYYHSLQFDFHPFAVIAGRIPRSWSVGRAIWPFSWHVFDGSVYHVSFSVPRWIYRTALALGAISWKVDENG